MEILTDSKIDFMKYRGVFVWVSIALLVVALTELLFLTGINFGIDFAGGTQISVHLRDEPDMDRLRRTFECRARSLAIAGWFRTAACQQCRHASMNIRFS